MSIEAPGGFACERSHPGEFSPDSLDSFGTRYPGDIFQDRSVSGPVFSSLQLFLLKTTSVPLTQTPLGTT
jgi:hypothetical protein